MSNFSINIDNNPQREDTHPEIIYITKQEDDLIYHICKKYKTDDKGEAIMKFIEENMDEPWFEV